MTVDEDILVKYLNTKMGKNYNFISVHSIEYYDFSKLIIFKYNATLKNAPEKYLSNHSGTVTMDEYEKFSFHIIRKEKIKKIKDNLCLKLVKE